MEAAKGIRINKYLSEVGHCSRRAADKLLEQGRITLNGTVPELGTKVMPGDVVEVDGKAVGQPTKAEDHVYIVYHKPVGIVCTTDQKRERDNIIDAVGHPRRIFPVGRLDKPSEGLIFLTSDGDVVNKILRARNHHEKEYHVVVDRPIRGQFLEDMAGGVPILDTVTRRCEVEQTGPRHFRIVLTQGLNRQIRRMCEHLGYEVVRLKRVRIMHMNLDLPLGEWRDFTAQELGELQRLVSDSGKTAVPGPPSTD
ncbi:MAG: 23S rRNA pseudouridine(2604) synthase RluF [Flavobacteriales bacterium]|jgi:23S rRNA pseudouridine2604 synthase|nr:23S rRNA pseudouridine(2604) synthase RluF [Flavobacteriales bacterium]